MGGQACIVYGGAEFSRDVDFAVDPASQNLRRIRAALSELQAEPAYFPPLSAAALRRGHACHFRCRIPDADGLRVDLMSKMRGVEDFQKLWLRRVARKAGKTSEEILLLSLPDLIRAKKTQRDKDWPMIRRMVDAEILSARAPHTGRIGFWLRECRSAGLLIELARKHPALARSEGLSRAAVLEALRGSESRVREALADEEEKERAADRAYWGPLKLELECHRLGRRRP